MEKTSQSRAIFPVHLNDNKTLFGGFAMKWMDEVAYITATRHTGKKMVTVSVKSVQFRQSVVSGDIIEIEGVVKSVGNVKIEVEVNIIKDGLSLDEKQTAITGIFVMAAVDDKGMPVKLST